jgi:GNAT superfamily N-acetyltransferase
VDAPRVRVRGAEAADAEALLDVQRASSLAAFGHIFPASTPFPDAEIRASWLDMLASREAEVLIAEEDGHALGLVSVFPANGLLERLFVRPERWGSGLAASLHDLALERIRAAGVGECWLWVLEENHRARAFYERRGWRPSGETRRTHFPPQPRALRYVREP